MKSSRLPCKTQLAANPCNGVNTGSMLRCKNASIYEMETKKVTMTSDIGCASPPNGRRAKTNNMHQAKPSHSAHGERRKKGIHGRWAGLQRERPQARSIQLQRGPPTTKGRTTRPLCLRPQETGEKEYSSGAAPPGKQGRGRSKASTQGGRRKAGGGEGEEGRGGGGESSRGIYYK